VNPLGEIVAVADRGTFMGNRGCLHDTQGKIRRPWQLERWIICQLEFKSRKRTVMTPAITPNCSSSTRPRPSQPGSDPASENRDAHTP
jgi:hypothetical protein